jgi:hypothetical protein
LAWLKHPRTEKVYQCYSNPCSDEKKAFMR